jgi:hypothetical protein
MGRRAEWQEVLNAETRHWSSMSSEYLIVDLHEVRAYMVEVDSKQYQVEVQLLENTNAYVHVLVGVDDGSLPWSIVPLTQRFIRQKGGAGVEV